MKSILLTGATGVIGSAVVEEILKDQSSQIYLIIRADSPAHLKERFGHMLDYWVVNANSPQASRLIPLLGDVGLERFGLDVKTYEQLSQTITHVVHCAASVKMNMNLQDALENSYVPTQNILDFAFVCHKQGQLKKVEYVSTIGVGGRSVLRMTEVRLTGNVDFHNTYEAAKAKAEKLVWEKVDHGFPITIHRPSMLVGNSQSGKIIHFQVFYHLAIFLSGKFTRGFLPLLKDTKLDIIPSDIVAKGIVLTMQDATCIGKVYHWVMGREASWDLDEIRQFIQDFAQKKGQGFQKLKLVPYEYFLMIIRILSWISFHDVKKRLKNLYVFLNYAKEKQVFENPQATALLAQAGITMPAVKDFLPTVFEYYYQRK